MIGCVCFLCWVLLPFVFQRVSYCFLLFGVKSFFLSKGCTCGGGPLAFGVKCFDGFFKQYIFFVDLEFF